MGNDMFDDLPSEIPDELRTELMNLATALRTAAAKIDVMVQRKKSKDLDDNNEPTFRYRAKVAIPAGFYLTKRLIAYARKHGMTDKDIEQEAAAFVRWYNKSGKKWMDWGRVWMDWVRSAISRKREGTVPMTSDRLRVY